MKSKPRKIILNVFIALFSVALISSATYGVVYYLYYHFNEELTVRLTNDVIVINDLVSTMYLVRTDSGYIAIDTGFDQSIIKHGLDYNKIQPQEIRAIFITHSDLDHQNAGKLFYKAKVYFPQEENEMIKNKISRFSFLPFIKNANLFERYTLTNDGDSFRIGNSTIKCISLPGHTPGSMGYIVNKEYLFSGDAFRIKDGKLALPNRRSLAMDIEMMKRSIEKVSKLQGVKYIFSAHSGFTADFQFAVSQ